MGKSANNEVIMNDILELKQVIVRGDPHATLEHKMTFHCKINKKEYRIYAKSYFEKNSINIGIMKAGDMDTLVKDMSFSNSNGLLGFEGTASLLIDEYGADIYQGAIKAVESAKIGNNSH